MPNTPLIDSLETETLTATQWARKLKVAPSTITRWALEGQLEHVQVGREIRITPAAMEASLRERTEARQRRYRDRTAGKSTRRKINSAEIDQELAII